MSYMTATSSVWGVWTNGKEIEFLYKYPESGRVAHNVIFGVPQFGSDVRSIGTHTYGDLKKASNLKLTFRRLLNELYTNTNISRREKLGNEMTKLLFCKLQDEAGGTSGTPKFSVGIDDHDNEFVAVRDRIDGLFKEVKAELSQEGVFDEHEKIVLENKSIAYVVGELQKYSLTHTDEDSVGNAFEVFAESKFAGEKGEFFTPREVVRTAVELIDPRPGELVMDPACGSGGFLICALQHIWRIMDESLPWAEMTVGRREREKRLIAKRTIYGLDKEMDLVKIAKAYMAILGDGKSRIAHANSLHALGDFDPQANDLLTDDGQFRKYDVILTNPPFGSKYTKVSESESRQFDLGHKWKKRKDGRYEKQAATKSTPTQELFIERCLDWLKPNGRLAIVLPETIAHAPTKKYIAHYIEDRATIKAVIDLPHNSFRPHCNAKTLLWIIEKRKIRSDIVFGVAREIGRDHLGKQKYRIQDGIITGELWDDTIRIRAELKVPRRRENQNVFVVRRPQIRDSIYVPRYYWSSDEQAAALEAEQAGSVLVPLSKLIESGVVQWFRGHGSPPNEYKGLGTIPYVRAGDIGNLSIYKNPTACVPEYIYTAVKGVKGVDLQAGDMVFVKEGSYRIGDVGVVLPSDTHILLNSHCLVFRVADMTNVYDIDSMYLAYLLTHPITKKQIYSKVFIDTTLPNIGNRWRDLLLPVHADRSERSRTKRNMRHIFDKRQEAEHMIGDLFQARPKEEQ